MKYLITGSKGQLGKEFLKMLEGGTAEVKGVDIEDIDISEGERVDNLINDFKPDIVLNCAAYNFVDKAESEPEEAFKTNAYAVQNLARACRQTGSFLVHYSTDYVFDGTKRTGLYTEEDLPNPLSVYGRSKLKGEELLREETENYLLFRLSWVFGPGRQNFIYKLKSWAEKNEILSIVYDEFSSPTYTADAANITLKALEKGIKGIYHLSCGGYASRYEWAKYILEELGIEKFIYPCSIKEFNLPARRPAFSAMSSAKISGELGLKIPDWRESTSIFINKQEK